MCSSDLVPSCWRLISLLQDGLSREYLVSVFWQVVLQIPEGLGAVASSLVVAAPQCSREPLATSVPRMTRLSTTDNVVQKKQQ